MDMSNLSTAQIAAIAAVLLILGGVIVYLLQRRRTQRLRSRFGEAEYQRTIAEGGDRRRAEARLEERAKRVESLHLRVLSAADKARFVSEWAQIQAHFVDAPAGAVTEADRLLGDVMTTRGYPVVDFEQRAADISVNYPEVTQNYRAAHEIAIRHINGQATTEDLRRAMIHYRALFENLVEERRTVASNARSARATEFAAGPSLRTR